MYICPRCGAFYKEGSVGFCSRDGFPLRSVSENDPIWEKGLDSIKRSGKFAARQSKIRSLRKSIKIAVVSTLVASVVFVIIGNTAVYVFTPEKPSLTATGTPDDNVNKNIRQNVSDVTPEISPAPEESITTPKPTVTSRPSPAASETPLDIVPVKSPSVSKPVADNSPFADETGCIAKENEKAVGAAQTLWNSLLTGAGVKSQQLRNAEIQKIRPVFSVSFGDGCKTAIVNVTSPQMRPRKFICANAGSWKCTQ